MKMNLPNKLTVARIIMVPITMALLMMGYNIWALVVFAIASFTDFLDGYIARKYNLVSAFGKIMDPLADKLLVFGALLAFIALGKVSLWAPMIIISREFFVTCMRVVAVAEGKVIAASMWGKIKTNVQLFALIFSMLFIEQAAIFIWVSALFTLASWVAYIVENKEVFRG